MAKATRKNNSAEGKDTSDDVGRVLAGIIGCGLLAAASDGEVADDERDTIVSIVSSFIEGAGVEASDDELESLTDELMHDLAEKGAEAVLQGLPRLLQEGEERRTGCLTAAAVTAADGDVSRDEAKGYYEIAKVLGFDRKDAEAIWEEATQEEED